MNILQFHDTLGKPEALSVFERQVVKAFSLPLESLPFFYSALDHRVLLPVSQTLGFWQ